MLDIKSIREDTAKVIESNKNRSTTVDTDTILALDQKRREIMSHVETLKNKRNVVSKEIGALKKSGRDAAEKTQEMKNVGEEVKTLDAELRDIEENLKNLLLTVPNIPHESTPVGNPPEANKIIKEWGCNRHSHLSLKRTGILSRILGW